MASDQLVSVDSARLSDLSPLGWASLGLVTVSALYGLQQAVVRLSVGDTLGEPLFLSAGGVVVGAVIALA